MSGSASQSSTGFGGSASRAIYNNSNGAWSCGSVTHTNNGPNTSWQVDLAQTSYINQIVVWNRTDNCCSSRLSNYSVQVLNSDGATIWQETYATPLAHSQTINLNVTGSAVRIELDGVLSLAEVQVFGEAVAASSAKQVAAATGGALLGEELSPSITVYPIPFSSELNVRIPSDAEENTSLRLVDMQGRTVFERQHLYPGEELLITENFVAGFYILQWQSATGQILQTQKATK